MKQNYKYSRAVGWFDNKTKLRAWPGYVTGK